MTEPIKLWNGQTVVLNMGGNKGTPGKLGFSQDHRSVTIHWEEPLGFDQIDIPTATLCKWITDKDILLTDEPELVCDASPCTPWKPSWVDFFSDSIMVKQK